MAASNYFTLATAIQQAIIGLALPTLQAAQVLLKEFPTLREADGVAQPVNAILVTKADRAEQEVGTLTGADDYKAPVLVTFARASNQNNAWDDVGSQWRESTAFLFHNKRLPAVPSVCRCLVEFKTILDPQQWHDANVSLGQLLVWPIYRRVRT